MGMGGEGTQNRAQVKKKKKANNNKKQTVIRALRDYIHEIKNSML